MRCEDNYKRHRSDRCPSTNSRRRRRMPERLVRREREAKEATSRNSKENNKTTSKGDRESQCSAVVKYGFINMIEGGLGGGGDTANARKNNLGHCLAVEGRPVAKAPKSKQIKKPKIVWDEEDIGDVIPGHDDALVIQVVIANFGVNRVFIDHDSSADILFLPCFQALGYTLKDLKPIVGDLQAFNSTTSKLLGIIEPRLSLGTSLPQNLQTYSSWYLTSLLPTTQS